MKTTGEFTLANKCFLKLNKCMRTTEIIVFRYLYSFFFPTLYNSYMYQSPSGCGLIHVRIVILFASSSPGMKWEHFKKEIYKCLPYINFKCFLRKGVCNYWENIEQNVTCLPNINFKCFYWKVFVIIEKINKM